MPSLTPPQLEQPQPAQSLLRNSNFILLWCAYGVSAVGDHLSEMAILKTQGALNEDVDITPLTARMTLVFFAAFFFLSPFTGLLADRFPRRQIMVVADVARCAIMLFLGALIGLTQDWGPIGPFWPLLLVGAFAAMFSPARAALLPTIIRPAQLVRANGLLAGLGIIGTMAAGVIGGYLADHYEAHVAFRLDALTFAVSALFLLALRLPRRSAQASEAIPSSGILRPLSDGARYVRGHRHVRELIIVSAIVWFSGALARSVLPAVVKGVYEGTFTTISVYLALIGVGFVLGAIIVAVLGDALRGAIAITWGLIGLGLGLKTLALSTYLPADRWVLMSIGGCGVVFVGMSAAITMASFNALLQRTVSNNYRGRVFGIKDLVTVGSLLVATGLLGVPQWPNLDRWSGPILLLAGATALAAGVVTMRVRLGRSPFGFGLAFVHNLIGFWCRFWWRLERVGHATLPRRGAAIVTANHNCSADPLMISVTSAYRPISFMIAAEYANWPLVRTVVRLVDCIPVKRDGGDTIATKRAFRRLKGGAALGIFIEGGIRRPGDPPTLKDGVALLALRTGAPVIPAYICGTKYHDSIVRGLFARHHAQIRYGPPVDLSEYSAGNRQDVHAATRKIYEAIQSLAPSHEKAGEEAQFSKGAVDRDC